MAEQTCSSCSSQESCQDNDNEEAKLRQSLSRIQNKIVVLSGKGGVGKSSMAVNIAVGGEFQDKVWAVADIKVLREVIVATRPLKRHQEIAEADIQVRRMDMARLPSNFLTDFGEILGKRTSRSIDVNTVLRPDLVEFPPLVKRGDVVTVVAESTGLRITAVGVVKERNGRRGERIRVENIDSKKSIYAQVVDAKTVKIDF